MVIWEEHRSTIVFVTHDVDEALLLSDRILVLSQQPGTVVAEIPVPFPRPRRTELTLQKGFLDLKRTIASQLGLDGLGTEVETPVTGFTGYAE